MSDYRIIVADVMKGLASMADESCQVCVTSPPYWGLRDYGTAEWEGGDKDCSHRPPDEAGASQKQTQGQREHAGRFSGPTCYKCGARRIDAQIGLEPTLDAFVEKMVSVFGEVRRVLRKDGCLFLNLGDSYCGGGGYSPDSPSNKEGSISSRGAGVNGNKTKLATRASHGLKPKDLCGVPWRVALALQADGWYLRSAMPWMKRNPMPESCRDRPTSAIEYVFMLTKSSRYYWDADAVRVAHVDPLAKGGDSWCSRLGGKDAVAVKGREREYNPLGRNFRNSDIFYQSIKPPHGLISDANGDPLALDVNPQAFKEAHFATYPEKLVEPLIKAGSRKGDTVLDCFSGVGTTGVVALRHGREYIGIELS